jgi:hypothetical protein
MTFFAPGSQNLQLPTDLLKFTIAKKNQGENKLSSTVDIIDLTLTKDYIPHNDFLNIKKLTLKLKLLNNNYSVLKKIYETYYLQKTKTKYDFVVDNDKYFIQQDIPKNADPFFKIEDALKNLNALYNDIDDLPLLEIDLLNNYIFENGFNDKLELNIASLLRYKHVNYNEYKEENNIGQNYLWANNSFDFKNSFKFEIFIDYTTERI